MKKILLSLTAMLLALPTFAQYESGGFKLDDRNLYYGVRLGMTVSSMTGETQYFKPGGAKVGLALGGVVGLRLSEVTPIFLESGVYYVEKGASGQDVNEQTKKENIKGSLTTLELPILVKYGFKPIDEIAILPYFGPYFNFALGGQTNKHSSFNNGYMKHFDMGFKLGCGLEYNMLYFDAGYQFGVSNASNNDDFNAHNHGFVASFGVNF